MPLPICNYEYGRREEAIGSSRGRQRRRMRRMYSPDTMAGTIMANFIWKILQFKMKQPT